MNTETFYYGGNNQTAAEVFDLFRLSKSKQLVDISSNTLRAYNKQGLPFHRNGKVVFVSRRELDDFIRNGGQTQTDKGSSNAVPNSAN